MTFIFHICRVGGRREKSQTLFKSQVSYHPTYLLPIPSFPLQKALPSYPPPPTPLPQLLQSPDLRSSTRPARQSLLPLSTPQLSDTASRQLPHSLPLALPFQLPHPLSPPLLPRPLAESYVPVPQPLLWVAHTPKTRRHHTQSPNFPGHIDGPAPPAVQVAPFAPQACALQEPGGGESNSAVQQGGSSL